MRTYRWSGVSIDGLDNLRRWMDAMKERPGCQRGVEVPFKEQFAKTAQKMVQR